MTNSSLPETSLFAAARRYVAHPLHQAYVRDHASQVLGARVVVQHDWTGPTSQ